MSKSLYLAGPITGLTYEGSTEWRRFVAEHLMPDVVPLSPIRGKEYLKGVDIVGSAYAQYPLSTEAAILGRDRYDVMIGCDAILVNVLGAEKPSIGTIIEIGWADAVRKPIILVIEDENNVHDYPMIRQAATFRTPSIDIACRIANSLLSDELARSIF
jgi:nucleoside 2-deoxyribosyltransferase